MTHPLQHLIDDLAHSPWATAPEVLSRAVIELANYIIAQEKPDNVPRATLDDVF
jgi:hypothetical protein